MNEPDEREAERAAAALTDRQRKAIIGATDIMSNHGGYPFYTVEFTDPWTEPVAQFLTLRADRLTPLGLAVRQHLQEQNNDRT